MPSDSDAPEASSPGGAPARSAAEDAAPRPRKAPSAFRTISEVAEDLHIPQHVLRFWESKFPQLKPLKRGGGRRYYRPDDIALLRRISGLLYEQGYTIKGVQRLLRQGGAEGSGAEAGSADEGGGAESDAADETPAEAHRALLRDCLAELEEIARLLRGLGGAGAAAPRDPAA